MPSRAAAASIVSSSKPERALRLSQRCDACECQHHQSKPQPVFARARIHWRESALCRGQDEQAVGRRTHPQQSPLMAIAPRMPSVVERSIAELLALDLPTLRAHWSKAFGRPAPKWMSRDLLLRALAYRIQEQTEGGLSKTALNRLRQFAGAKDKDTRMHRLHALRPKPGMRLVREWRGEVHQVTVLDSGFDYRGTHYASLSKIAREITGTRWSGPRFFGLHKADGQSPKATNER